MDDLKDWATKHGAIISPAVEIYHDNQTGNSFRTKADHHLESGDSIVTLPFGLTLSYLNTLDLTARDSSISSSRDVVNGEAVEGDDNNIESQPGVFISRDFLDNVPPHVIARFYLMRQYLLGRQSFWYPYIRTLPQPENVASWALPPIWPADDVELLEDTNIHTAITEIKARLKTEYKHAMSFVPQTVPNRSDYSRLLYHWAYCIFTSRSFRPSLVIPDWSSLPLPAGCGIDDFHILMPLFDIGNHLPTAKISWDTSSPSEDHSATTTLVTRTSYGPSKQIFNHYGSKTNAELMLAYGFLIPETPDLHNDYVHVRLRPATATATATAPEDAAAASSAHSPNDNKPRDYLFSLRPATDPSSVTMRHRLLLPDIHPASTSSSVLPPFKYVEDTLVWELILLQTTSEQRETLFPVAAAAETTTSSGKEQQGAEADKARLSLILTGRTPPEFRPVLEQTIAIIQAKAMQELEKLEQSDFELDAYGFEPTKNQRMVCEYRARCREVLTNVLESIEMPPE